MTLPVYLQSSLANHRRGRLLGKLLKAEASEDSFPDAGLMLMPGQEFQALALEKQEEFFNWCSQPGRTLILIPPFSDKPVSESGFIDWHFTYRESPVAADKDSLPGVLADEVNLSLQGTDGAFDSEYDHQWLDMTPNSRYWKKHAGTGVFAATVLPLWSISLLGHGELLQSWLEPIHSHAGKASDSAKSSADQQNEVVIKDTDYTTMVCIHGWSCQTLSDLTDKLYVKGGIPVFSIEQDVLDESLKRLKQAKYLVADESLISLSEAGVSALEASPYLAYADSLRESL